MTSIAAETWFSAPALRRVFDLLNADGGEVRIVGGAVRNALMGLAVGDIDMATTLLPDEVVRRAQAAGIKSVPTGIAHGTVTLVIDRQPFEVTTLRRDVETDGRHAEVAFGTDWTVDAARRDLTINALYADANGEVIDLIGGMADIETRTVRFIGDAQARVAEDYLRVLRFFRFFAFYGSGRPDADGLRACAQAKSKLSTLSAERIWSETKKLLGARDPGRALLWMRQAGVLTAVLPETEKWGIDAIPALVAAETVLQWQPDPLLRLAAIVPPDAERLEAMAARLRLSKVEGGSLQQWATSPPVADTIADTAFDRLLYWYGPAGIIPRLKLMLAGLRAKAENDPALLPQMGKLQRLLTRAADWKKPVFPLSGTDVLQTGITAGPRVGEILAALEKQWVEGNFHADRATLVARLGSMVS
ncbi:CCA tRNA nucleotidyltransferase [Pararhizobium antarcticum]|uniref:Poly(A) polymerase n=1 Tax=Pararhizobium antarcticum TaxID=1798805 RepID=A0A657LTG2_9HYPH|nr:CCA tRNA nucleotidyltransferase [Pararhizobium antarcticum]OJF96828.1 poly(A) polymerase [Pararhizobium antarcticum]OJF99002.1 poly(A) polymerase [Rhizobium sp. 58]